MLGKAIEHEHNLADLLRRPDVSYLSLMSLEAGKYANPDLLPEAQDEVSRETLQAVIEQIEIASKYAGYIDRQRDEVQRAAHYENLKLPEDLDYNQITALSIEIRQRLTRYRPETLGQASRLSGITPAAISLLLIHLKRSRVKGFGADVVTAEASVG